MNFCTDLRPNFPCLKAFGFYSSIDQWLRALKFRKIKPSIQHGGTVLWFTNRFALKFHPPFFRAQSNNLICHNYKWLFKNPAALISATRNFGRLECVGKLSSLHQMDDFILQMNLYMRWFPNFSCILKYFSLQSPNIRLQNLNMVHCLSLSKLVLQLGPTHPWAQTSSMDGPFHCNTAPYEGLFDT